ncbi:MAG: flavin reductase family protein [Azospirillaceae bacterium]
MFYDPRSEPHGLPHDPWTALVVPRPIGWISTMSAQGVPNLAPYSFFNAVSARPPFVMFASGSRKDTLANAEATGVFAVNLATAGMRRAVNRTSTVWAPDVNEFEEAGLSMADCRNIPCGRVAQSPVCIECRLTQTVRLRPSTGAACDGIVAFGEVVGIHIDPGILVDGLIDVARLQPLGRLGYMDYTVIETAFTMARPAVPDAEKRMRASDV